MGVFRYQELRHENENSWGLTIEGLHFDCAKMSMLKPDFLMTYFGIFWYQKLIQGYEKLPKVAIDAHNSIFLQMSTLSRNLNRIFGGSYVSGTRSCFGT